MRHYPIDFAGINSCWFDINYSSGLVSELQHFCCGFVVGSVLAPPGPGRLARICMVRFLASGLHGRPLISHHQRAGRVFGLYPVEFGHDHRLEAKVARDRVSRLRARVLEHLGAGDRFMP
jgi:hypothetical protein